MASPHYLQTIQRTCHADDGQALACERSVQDASFADGAHWPEPCFMMRDDEVTDNLTGLVWCRDASPAVFHPIGRQQHHFSKSK